MVHANALVLSALIVVAVVTTITRVLSARRARGEDAYQRWLSRTRRMLVDARKDPQAYERRGYFLGQSVLIAEQEQRFASRAIDEGDLAWAHGHQFVKLPSSLGSPSTNGERETGT